MSDHGKMITIRFNGEDLKLLEWIDELIKDGATDSRSAFIKYLLRGAKYTLEGKSNSDSKVSP